jgi:light-regulated signal transduction histidine kinase (bacteriophytochrome)
MREDELRQQLDACQRKVAELERRLVENTAAMRQSNEDLRQFAYVASHDFREPLRAIVSYTQLIERRYGKDLDEPAHEFMRQVISSANRLSQLADGLLSYSRVSTAETISFDRVSLTGVLAGVLLKLDQNIRESDASIEFGELPDVFGEEQALERLFNELIANALLYRSEQRPQVNIAAREDGEFWLFAVSDNGIGIEPAYHDRIFGLFKRLHSRSIPGTGLGLAICRRIVERHGGKMWVESQAGQGTTFRFTLPA